MPRIRKASKREKPISDKQRAADDELRKLLHDADLDKFDNALRKAVVPAVQRKQ